MDETSLHPHSRTYYVFITILLIIVSLLGIVMFIYLIVWCCEKYRPWSIFTSFAKILTKDSETALPDNSVNQKDHVESSAAKQSVYIPMKNDSNKKSSDLLLTSKTYSAPLDSFMKPTPVQPRLYSREPVINSGVSGPIRSSASPSPVWAASGSRMDKPNFIVSQPVSRGSIENISSSSPLNESFELEEKTEYLSKGENKNLGEIHFTVTYNVSRKTLFVTILEARSLPVMDATDLTNAYVHVLLEPLSPSSENSRQSSCSLSHCGTPHSHLDTPFLITRIARRTLRPQWNEIFTLNNIAPHDLLCHAIALEVRDSQQQEDSSQSMPMNHSIDEDPLIGLVRLSLKPLYEPQAPEKSFNLWRYLQPGSKCRHGGELLIGLGYKHRSSSMTIQLLEARHLHAKEDFLIENIYACVMITNSSGKVLYKTSNLRSMGYVQPLWGSKMKLKRICRNDLSTDCVIVIRLYVLTDEHKSFPGLALGEVCIPTQKHSHWSRVMSSDRQIIQCWHPIHPLLRNYKEEK